MIKSGRMSKIQGLITCIIGSGFIVSFSSVYICENISIRGKGEGEDNGEEEGRKYLICWQVQFWWGGGGDVFHTVSIRDESILDSNGILGVTGTP